MVRAPVGEAVDEPRVAVVGEDDGTVRREQRVKLRVGEPVRVLGVRLQPHEVDDVHDPHAFSSREMLAQDRDGGEGLERRNVPAAGHYEIGLEVFVVWTLQMPIPRAQWTIASSTDK